MSFQRVITLFIFSVAFVGCANTLPSSVVTSNTYPAEPYYREYDSQSSMHMSTTVDGEGSPAFEEEFILVQLYTGQSTSTLVPLYRCHTAKGHNSTLSSSCEGISGAILDGQQGWIDTVQQTGEVPLYRLYTSNTGDYMDSTTSNEGASLGYVLNATLGYALPANL
jgi:hypothetical protein